MRTKKEIKKQKQSDLQFIISAVTNELHNVAYLRYFDTWENNGGMGWFFNECVDITKKIMLTKGSRYLKWLDYWKETKEGDYIMSFYEFNEDISNCFDWYHMNEAMKEFKLRYREDECPKEQISEHIGHLINSFELSKDRADVWGRSIEFAEKLRISDLKRGRII